MLPEPTDEELQLARQANEADGRLELPPGYKWDQEQHLLYRVISPGRILEIGPGGSVTILKR